jgi:hypothetical protein
VSSKTQPRLTCRIFPFLSVRDCPPDTREVEFAVLADGKSRAPLRVALEKRSNYAFLQDLQQSLSMQGVDPAFSLAALVAVINEPSVALSNISGGSENLSILQAVLVRQPDSEIGSLRVTLTAEVRRSKPPEIVQHHILVEVVDPESDVLEMMSDLERWRKTYNLREATRDPGSLLAAWAWLGDPSTCGYQAVPHDWHARVTGIGAVAGIETNIVVTANQARAQNVLEAADVAVLVRGARGWDKIEQLSPARPVVLPVGQPGMEFETLLQEGRKALLNRIDEIHISAQQSERLIAREEMVFHRKLTSTRNYDVFDEGHEKACIHGRESFVPFKSADKASKGMARIYSNFVPAMLFHCRHYPNCGMYAVDGSRGAWP